MERIKKALKNEKGEMEMSELFDKLQYAKKAVLSTLENDNCLVDWHGLSYWASEVERLRQEIKNSL